jgi:hypothetical protein
MRDDWMFVVMVVNGSNVQQSPVRTTYVASTPIPSTPDRKTDIRAIEIIASTLDSISMIKLVSSYMNKEKGCS